MFTPTTLKRGVSRCIPCIANLISDMSDNGLYYVNGPETLPPPLSQEREAELMEMLEDHREEVSGELIEHNLRLVVYIAKKFENTGVYIEDLVSIGTIGLIKAVNTFSPSKNIKLATYASRCIENEIFMHFRIRKKNAQEISMDEPIDTDSDGNPLTFSDIIFSTESVFDDVELKMQSEKLYQYIDNIDDQRKKEILIMRYGLYDTEPFTQREIAQKLGISRSYVSRIETKALEELRDYFEID